VPIGVSDIRLVTAKDSDASFTITYENENVLEPLQESKIILKMMAKTAGTLSINGIQVTIA